MDIFKREKDYYRPDIDPIKHYIKQASIFVSKSLNIPIEKATTLVKETLKESDIKNPRVKFRERDLIGNLSEKVTTLSNYFNYVKESGDLLVPSGTVYFHPNKKKSLHSEFAFENVARRSEHKKLAFKYKMEGDANKFLYHNTLQKVMKIFNNSLSGAYASAGTVLYNPTAHYTLTSITRCLSGIGNAISESMIAGNRHYRNPEVTLNHLTAILENLDYKEMENVINKYSLYIPTVNDVMDMIKKNTYRYWESEYYMSIIEDFVKKLTDIERAAIIYQNDLYRLALYNDKLVRKIFDKILNTDFELNQDPVDVLSNIPGWIYNLLAHVRIEDLKGRKFVITPGEKDELPKDIKIRCAKTAVASMSVFKEYEDLIKALFVTKTFPISIGYIKEMLREVIVLSDTDSTCATYQNWIEWYNGDLVINPTTIGVTAIVMTFVTQSIDHYIRLLSSHMNTSEDRKDILKMKNEFFWDVFANTDVAKHYYSMVRVQEGNVYKEGELEVKGVNLIASTIYHKVRELGKRMMVDILETIGRNEKIELKKYLKQIADTELMIKEKLLQGSPEILKLQKIKTAESYKSDDISKTPYLHYLLWQEVFASKYGNAPDPTYIAVKVPVILNSKKEMEAWLNSLHDQELADSFRKFLNTYKKDVIKTFNIPLVISIEKGLPEELLSIVDVDRVIKDNCNMLYMIISSLGFYIKPDMKVYELLNDPNIDKILEGG